MTRSIRGRLQLWFAGVLTVALLAFAGLVFAEVRRARLHEADVQLLSAADSVEAGLRPGPPGPPPREPPRDGPGFPGRPPFEPRPDARPSPPPPPDDVYFGVWRGDGVLTRANNLPPDTSPHSEIGGRMHLYWRDSRREVVRRRPDGSTILVGRDLSPVFGSLALFAAQLVGVGVVVLASGLVGCWLIASRIVRPLRAISETAAKVSASNLSERIVGPLDQEVSELAGVLNATLDRLQEAVERQTRFTADASHELRTPLAVLRMHAELALSRPRAVEEYQRALRTCVRAAGRMNSIVEELLTLARADAGRLELVREPVNVGDIALEAVEMVRPLAESKGVTLSVEPVEAWVVGDADALARVTLNLLTNAVQHNRPDGSASVVVAVDGVAVVLSVSDTGPGIALADRPHLFERFFRADKARSRASGGTGLGLAICRALVSAHGGTIDFESRLGEGTTFRVRLPVGEGIDDLVAGDTAQVRPGREVAS